MFFWSIWKKKHSRSWLHILKIVYCCLSLFFVHRWRVSRRNSAAHRWVIASVQESKIFSFNIYVTHPLHQVYIHVATNTRTRFRYWNQNAPSFFPGSAVEVLLFNRMKSRPLPWQPLVRNPGVHTLAVIFNKMLFCRCVWEVAGRLLKAGVGLLYLFPFFAFFFQHINVPDCIIIVIIIHHRLGYMHW